ncbi:transcriptional repressor LexA [Eubacteriales bacterium KG127]
MADKISKSQLRENKILEYIAKEIKIKGYPPTVREICDALNIKSTSTVHKDIASLIAQGRLKKDPSKPRAITIVGNDDGEIAGSQSNHDSLIKNSEISNPNDNYRDDVIDVPIVGRIAAGTPILADQNLDDIIPVPARYVKGENFMLRVRGESMINVGIMDGDLILVEKSDTASNGDIVVAMIDGFESEATVKTFYKENGKFRLQPENDEMSPIIVHDVKILGQVKGVFRFFS